MLAATLSAVGHLPVAGLALILGIDRFMSEARALTNLVGNGVATVVVSKWCKQLDEGTCSANWPARATLRRLPAIFRWAAAKRSKLKPVRQGK